MIKKDIGIFLLITIAVLIGVTFLIASANSVKEQTSSLSEADETLSIAAARLAGSHNINSSVTLSLARATTRKNGTLIENFVLTNSTGYVIGGGNYTLNTTSGTLTLSSSAIYWNTTQTYSNVTLADYDYYTPNYYGGTAGTVTTLIIVFGALAILVVVFVYFLKQPSLKSFVRGGTPVVRAE